MNQKETGAAVEIHRRHLNKKWPLRVLAGVIAVGAVVMGSMALFSDSETSSANNFGAGKVTVGLGASSTTCSVTLLMPDDSSTGYGSGSQDKTPCNYKVEYTGNVNAWIAADILVEAGTPTLYTADADGLQFKVAVAGGATLMNGTTYATQAGANTSVVAGTSVKNILLKATPASTGDLLQFDIDYLLPRLAPNALQGGSAKITITFHAVQSAHQPIGSCVAGRQCGAITWS